MPTLHWIGKDKVVNHHQDVPFRVMEHRYGFADGKELKKETGSGNKIIHGDNLEALKTLLPEYEGKIKCIYIDPPYNTGNESWVYNDNVNDPKIKKWLGEVVGKEGEDLSRHDKWLCMMYPRVKLLQKLMAQDALFIMSLDDNEVAHGILLLNEIFGASHKLACAPWLSEPSGGKEKTKLRGGHEYILIYHNGDSSCITREERSTGELNQKDKLGVYRKGRELRKWGGTSLRSDRENQWFELKAPNGEIVFPYRNDGKEGHWRWGKEQKMKPILQDPDVAHWELCPFDDGIEVNGNKERWVPFEKIRELKKTVGWGTWLDKVGYNSDGTKVLKEIFGEKPFDTPKPPSLLEWLISLHQDDDLIVLDSFAGSGTTAHAVLNLNKEDGGNRKVILIEMEDYAETITAERVRRVIKGYGDVPGTGGSFDYYTLGEPLFDEDKNINENLPVEKIRQYVYYTETGKPLGNDKHGDNDFFLSLHEGAAYYLYYKKGEATALDYDFLGTIKTKGEMYVIYADNCLLPAEFMKEKNIFFKKIPRDIARV